MNLKEVVINYKNKYGESEIVDYIKLVYQSVFGGSHLIKNKEISLFSINKEYDEMNYKDNDDLYFEMINGTIRINLDSIKRYNISIEELNEMFYNSSMEIKGSINDFNKYINELRILIIDKTLNFDIKEFDDILTKIKNNNYSPISHSDKYHLLYNPHYRVILKKYLVNKLK